MDVADVRRDLLERPAVPHRALSLGYRTQSEPRYTAGSPGRQRWTKRFIGGWRTISSSSSSEKSRRPRIAASCDLDVLERAVREVGAEDDVDDVALAGSPIGGDRLGDRDRAFQVQAVPDPDLLAQLAPERRRQRLAAVDASTGQEPVLLAGLLLAAEQHPILPAQQPGDADARPRQCRDDPKPRTPRSDSGSSSTSTSSTAGRRRTTSWRSASRARRRR